MFKRVFPARDANAPFIARLESWKPPFRMRRHQIVPIQDREIEKLLRDLNADRVKSEVFGTRAAIAVPVKSGHRVATTATEVGPENVGWHGGMVLKERPFPNRYCCSNQIVAGKSRHG